MRDDAARVVVTGVGAVCSLGGSCATIWPRLLAGDRAIASFTLFPSERHRTQIAGQALPERLADDDGTLSRTDRFAIAATHEALTQARFDPSQSRRTAVLFGSSTGGLLEGERCFAALRDGNGRISARIIAAQQNGAPGDAVARRFRVRGPVHTSSTACVSSSMALDEALAMLDAGECDVAIVGGADGLCQITYAGFNALRAVDAQPSRPFTAERAGLSLGEGAAVLVLERASHARARGASPLAVLAGAASTCDAHHMSAPAQDGSGAAHAIELALAAAGCVPDDVDFVDAHGTGTPLNDAAEAQALRSVFGARAATLPVTSTKAAVGHLLGSSGTLEAVVTVLALREGLVPPTPGDEPTDPMLGVDLVRDVPRQLARCEVGLSTNLAFGGANTALVFRRVATQGEGDRGTT